MDIYGKLNKKVKFVREYLNKKNISWMVASNDMILFSSGYRNDLTDNKIDLYYTEKLLLAKPQSINIFLKFYKLQICSIFTQII